jgi:hypothetical protein
MSANSGGAQPGVYGTHPSDATRIANIRAMIPTEATAALGYYLNSCKQSQQCKKRFFQ